MGVVGLRHQKAVSDRFVQNIYRPPPKLEVDRVSEGPGKASKTRLSPVS